MVDFNGFDKGVIGKRLPSDTTLNCMKKSELIKLLHLAEDNHRALAEAYKISVDTNKCNLCPLGLDKRRADEIRADAIDECIHTFLEAKVNGLVSREYIENITTELEQLKEKKE